MMETADYVTQIFRSFMGRHPGSDVTKEKWLDGNNGWRDPLHRIGEMAQEIAAISDIADARREWLVRLNGYLWVEGYIAAVPLLNREAMRARLYDESFRDFMKNLATLAQL